MNDLSGRDLHEYKVWRKNDGGLKPISLKGQLDALKAFLQWCESIDAVREGLHEKIVHPTLSKSDEVSDVKIGGDEAEKILEYLRQFEYGSRKHVLFGLLWHTGVRMGSLYALDVGDYYPDERYLELVHRPNEGTPLKNQQDGERLVAVKPEFCEVIEDWISHVRSEVTDEYGRKPLLATKEGRMSKSCMRETVYAVTRPCIYSGTCPHSRDQEDCEAMEYGLRSRCPSSKSPHSARRGSITYHLLNDVPEKYVSDRMNVSQDVLDKHYDKRTEEEKVEQRREFLSNV
jgi:integrase